MTEEEAKAFCDAQGIAGKVPGCVEAAKAGSGVRQGVADAVTQPIADLVNSMLDRTLDSLVYFMTFWLKTPSASLDSADPVGAAITATQGYFATITAFFAILGFFVAAVRMAWTARAEPAKEIGKMLLVLLFVQGAALTVTQMTLKAGDEFSPWLVEQVSGGSMNHSIVTLMPFITGTAGAYAVSGGFVVAQGIGAMLIVGIIVLLASIMQVVFLLLRDVLLALILAFLPTLAAASLFKGGAEGFEKACGWIVALVLYKPVAAGIYALGVLMVTNVAGDQSTPGQEWMAMILGTITLILAVFALPALVKFVAPAAGRGVSGAFSGGAAVGAAMGAVATGAAVVAVAGTGGAAAPAAGAATAGTGAGAGAGAASSGTGAAQAAGATEAAGMNGASSSGASSGGGGGGTGSGGAVSGSTDSNAPASGSSGASAPGGGGGSAAPSGSSGGPASSGATTGSDSGGGAGSSSTPDGQSGGATGASGASEASTGSGDAGGGSSRSSAISSLAQTAGSQVSDNSGATIEDMTK